MRQVLNCGVRLALGLALVSLAPATATADLTESRITDPNEHAAMMRLGALVRHTDYEKTRQLIGERPEWSKMPQLQVKLAFALLTKKKDHAGCRVVSQQLVSSYRQSDPATAGWGQLYLIRCLVHEKEYDEAAQACMEWLASFSDQGDLTPVLHVQRTLGLLTSKYDVDPAVLSAAASKHVGSSALVKMGQCADRAERADPTAAKQYLQGLVTSLPAGDKRIALAAAGLIQSTSYAYDRDTKQNAYLLPLCQEAIPLIEQTCPQQRWLIARAKLTLAGALIRSGTQLQNAEQYCHDVIGDTNAVDLIPEARAQLSQVLYIQRRYSEAADEVKAIVDRFPYSSWVDYAAYFYGDCLYRTGKTAEAKEAMEAVVEDYPESDWAMKATFWRKVNAR